MRKSTSNLYINVHNCAPWKKTAIVVITGVTNKIEKIFKVDLVHFIFNRNYCQQLKSSILVITILMSLKVMSLWLIGR